MRMEASRQVVSGGVKVVCRTDVAKAQGRVKAGTSAGGDNDAQCDQKLCTHNK